MVAILLGEGFEESEALVPADLLRRAGIVTALVGVDGSVVRGSHGIAVQADLALEQVDPDELDMLVLPGGMGGVASIQMNLFATALIQRSWERGLYLAAICAAPTILAGMGILDRRRAVCYPGMEDEMGSAVVRQGQHVVVDGHIITAEAAGSAFEFGLKLVEILSGRACAEQVKQEVHYHY
ncbi:4-methyl-5(B-hydroxyethyl)-thiazole monophosphate biosynthesis protein [Oscillospiraceae bacterium]|nr:4-methyl-5(B-hydroxyethyl)-thiazole monophosphate biosynthesis protein [Oscillospiraceae bacterium]BDF74236.1 4-methyl-5(B-hydroxyethyl)-thiazole monophosphate biosynthesis protein [Oscillospiraceae bacterium]